MQFVLFLFFRTQTISWADRMEEDEAQKITPGKRWFLLKRIMRNYKALKLLEVCTTRMK
jgi:hypothetical protein